MRQQSYDLNIVSDVNVESGTEKSEKTMKLTLNLQILKVMPWVDLLEFLKTCPSELLLLWERV
jgi:hypothetical protein